MRLKKEIKKLEAKKRNLSNQRKEATLVPAYKSFGFENNEAFTNWCFEHKITLKNTINSKKENEIRIALKNESLEQSLVCKKIAIKNFNDAVLAYKNNEIQKATFGHYIPFVTLCEKHNFNKDIIELSNVICSNKKLLKENQLMPSKNNYEHLIENLHSKKSDWIRNLNDWHYKGKKNSDAVINSLITHLFDKYETSDLIKKVWLKDSDKGLSEYIKIAAGESIVVNFKKILEVNKLPTMSKKDIHVFLSKKHQETDFFRAYKRAILEKRNINKNLINYVIKGVDSFDFNQHKLFEDLLVLIEKETFFDKSQIFPMWDYVLREKQQVEALDKKFELKGRSVAKLLNAMEEWHAELSKMTSKRVWPNHLLIQNYYEIKNECEKNEVETFITELCSENELKHEGNVLRHCIRSYADSCIKGRSSIWSYHETDFGMKKKKLTIQVVGDGIVQVRGKFNREATEKERNKIQKWANDNNLIYKDSY